ncbi:MAG: hypothetical protein ACD_51C00032G0002 [uncultured bacterium]|nr:MAG: hypothetical protein ACD_51C00032G0002 [uncultured bacterium]
MVKLITFWTKFKEVAAFLGIVLLLSVIVDLSVISLAQEEETVDSGIDTEAETEGSFECYNKLEPYLQAADADLVEFLNQSFTSAEPTSELVDLVMEKYYVEYVNNLDAALDAASETTGGESLAEVTDDIFECQDLISKHMEVNEQVLIAQVEASAAAKKTTALLDEYKWINERLADMNITVGKLAGQLTKIRDGFKFTKNLVQG